MQGEIVFKIKSVEAFQLPMGAGEATSPRCAFVRIETEDGQFGLGEASPLYNPDVTPDQQAANRRVEIRLVPYRG